MGAIFPGPSVLHKGLAFPRHSWIALCQKSVEGWMLSTLLVLPQRGLQEMANILHATFSKTFSR